MSRHQMDFDFNTSHVSIKPNLRRQQHGGIYFNTSHVSIKPAQTAFCRRKSKISIHPMFLLNLLYHAATSSLINFNTSHVSIKLKNKSSKRLEKHFNTSHVSIKLAKIQEQYLNMRHFNTSHVSIKLEFAEAATQGNIFQYIPCFY